MNGARQQLALAARLAATTAMAAAAYLTASGIPPETLPAPLLAARLGPGLLAAGLAALLSLLGSIGAAILVTGFSAAVAAVTRGTSVDAAAPLALALAASMLHTLGLRLSLTGAKRTGYCGSECLAKGLAFSAASHGAVLLLSYYGGVFALGLYEALLQAPRGLPEPAATVLRILAESFTVKLMIAATLTATLYYLASRIASPILYALIASREELRSMIKRSASLEAEKVRDEKLWYHRMMRWSFRLVSWLIEFVIAVLIAVLAASLLGETEPGVLAAATVAALLATSRMPGLLKSPPRSWRRLAAGSALLLALMVLYTALVDPQWIDKDIRVFEAALTGSMPPGYRVDPYVAARLAYHEGLVEKTWRSIEEALRVAIKLLWG